MKISFLVFCLLFSDGVFGDGIDEIKSMSVIEGDSVTLHTDVGEMQRVDLIVWTFGPENFRIAQINRVSQISSIYDVDDGRFRDRLLLDNKTGDLTITNIRIKHSGLYQLQTVGGIDVLPKKFSIHVFARLPIPVITSNSSQCSSSSKCVLVCSVVNVTQVTLSWYKGNSLFSSISVSDLNSSLSLPLEVEYQENNIYSCVINNPIRNQTKHLNINEVCQTCSVTDLVVHTVIKVVIFVGVLLVVAVAAGVIYYRHRNSRRAERDEKILGEQLILLQRDAGVSGAQRDGVRKVDVMEGVPVTLNSKVTELQENDVIMWKFGVLDNNTTPYITIAALNKQNNEEFLLDGDGEASLQLNHETGDLSIENIRTKHSGLYLLHISGSNIIFKSFFVTVQGEGKSVSVMEGGSVTLHTDLTEIQRHGVIIWKFGPTDTKIAQICAKKNKGLVYNGRLHMDDQTGSLTMTNITTEHSGVYELEIHGTKVFSKQFNVSVHVVNVTQVTLSWYKGNSLFSSISVSDLNSSLSLPLEVEYQENNIYSCVINNPIRNQTKHLNITEVCQPCSVPGLSSVYIVLICIMLPLLIVIGVVYYCRRKCKKDQNGQPAEESFQLNYGSVPGNEVDERDDAEVETSNQEIDSQKSTIPEEDDDKDDSIFSNDDVDVSDAERDKIKTMSVKEGDSVTLQTGVTEVQENQLIQWKFAASKGYDETGVFCVIAKWNRTNNEEFLLNKGTFKNRLSLTNQTGSLTITNIRVKHAGHYKLQITSNRNTFRTKTFSVFVCASAEHREEDPNETNLPLIPEEDPNDTGF
ncbi:uncharacterized protein LOC127438919 [Myxocyprinus asiaticus]|uniref:uncharacterized protein LOC127438919 n=1 Tax=Myxocyprinus asiaticus TaxID=70543 RepID=UPI0022233291|nr:uncharacterized protein LOC127438919 [Myxocyprinus asiaticus]